MPACAEMNAAIQDFTGQSFKSTEQHQDTTASRVKQDEQDITVMTCFLKPRNPFQPGMNLKNIVSGIVADSSVNVHNASVVGRNILKQMEGKTVKEYSFKHSQQAVTMAATSKNAIIIDSDVVVVDHQLLFQRLISAAENFGLKRSELFRYELSSFPTALFESPTFLRQANKADLADEIWKTAAEGMPEFSELETHQYVLDGGALLHLIPWQRGVTFATILKSYADNVKRTYGNPVIVFDGYSESSTKDMEHLRRGSRNNFPMIEFTPETMILSKKSDFLENQANKQRFVSYLRELLQSQLCTVIQADGDADLMIVAHAMESAKSSKTVVVADDTDILVLLCSSATNTSHPIHLQPSHRIKTKIGVKKRMWHIQHTMKSLGSLSELLPVIHAISGCDTTSRPFGLGKRSVFQKFKKSK